MMYKNTRRGFTLIELLVVVIIIAVLSAVALPMYKHAALKSRFSKVMPVAKSIVEAQEVYYLGKNIYAANDEKDLLDVAPSGATTIELASRDQEDKYNYVAASSSEVPGARYIMYQKHSPKFANTIQCEANENNLEAVWLCSKGLNGQLIDGSVNTAQGSYVTYLLSGTKKEGDTLPTSLEKLGASLCEGKTNCEPKVQGNTVITKECTTYSNGWACINTTYDAQSSQIGHAIRESLGIECYTSYCKVTFRNKDLVTGYEEFRQIECKDSSASQDGVCLGGVSSWTFSDIDSLNRGTFSLKIWGSEEWGDPYTGEIRKVADYYSSWTHYDGESPYAQSTTKVSYSGNNATFTTTSSTQPTRTETCALENADWRTGSCKPGTAIE